MQRKKYHEIEWLEFDLLSDIPRLKHAVFLRHGGCSEAPFSSLNAGFQTEDRKENVEENMERIKSQLREEIPAWNQFVWSRANHGKEIKVVDRDSSEQIENFDGIVTAVPHLTLLMKHADCQIALFYDPKLHIIANVHAGWRGSVENVYGETIQKMQKAFGSNPADLLVCISPSLGPDKAEFMHYRSELPEEFWSFQIRPTYFDFWSISEYQLQAAGILPHHIEVARLCTYSNSHDFFSHRRDKRTGRHATCITLI